jgi:hypothetical protein
VGATTQLPVDEPPVAVVVVAAVSEDFLQASIIMGVLTAPINKLLKKIFLSMFNSLGETLIEDGIWD